MPKSPKTRRKTRITSRPKRARIEESDDDLLVGDDAPSHDQHGEPDFETMLRRLMGPEAHAGSSNSKASVVYEAAQKQAKEVVKIGVFAVDEFKAISTKFREQEVEYETYDKDHQLTKQRENDGFKQFHACLAPMLQDLGRTRAYEINAICELVKSNQSHRPEILRNFSRSLRSRFEEAKKKEKETEDAEALIEMVKRILYF